MIKIKQFDQFNSVSNMFQLRGVISFLLSYVNILITKKLNLTSKICHC